MTAGKRQKDISGKIIDSLRQAGKDLRKTEIRRLLGLRGRQQYSTFQEAFQQLLQDGALRKSGRGHYALAGEDNEKAVVGRLVVHHRGFGFVTPAEGGPDIFIPPTGLNLALSGDQVEVSLTEQTERGTAGRIQRILERGVTELTGEFVAQGEDHFVRPLRRDFPEFIPLQAIVGEEDKIEPEHGDWIVARLMHPEKAQQPLRASVVRRLNTNRDLSDDLDAIVNEFELPVPYSPEQNQAAAEMPPRQEDVTRQPLEDLMIMTIDPQDAKDFDDALSIQPGPDGDSYRVGVHIAEVAAFVAPDSELDRQARQRSFTAYLPGRTLPMLPRPLAAELCSLKEGLPRAAHSVFMTVSRHTGEVLDATRCHSRIKVSKRLNFEQVQAVIEGTPPTDISREILDAVRSLNDLATTMRRRRAEQEAYLELSTSTVRVLCQEDPPLITGLKHEEQNLAHQLVEEFMLAANVAVGRELKQKNIPGIYRIHAEPEPGAMAEFRTWAREALNLHPGHLTNRQAVNQFLAGIESPQIRDIVHNAFLRTLPRAEYSATADGHFGLGKDCYAHFTSPIRRYPDLIVHQQLWAFDAQQSFRPESACAEIAQSTTALEANNDQAYFAALDRLKLRYIRELQDQGQRLTYEGVIARLLPEALLINVPELGLFGTLPKQLLGNEDFHFSKRAHELRGAQSGKVYRCGHVIYVRIEKADIIKGTLILKPVRA